jgi:hypothetical protein
MEDGNTIGMFAIAGAILLVAWRIRSYRKALEKASYPTVAGTIVRSELEVREESSTDDNGVRDVSYEYVPHVEFTYNIGGRTFRGDRIHILESRRSHLRSDAARVLEAYPLQASVKVYHNPADPADAFLENTPGTRMVDGGTWFAAGILILLGLAMIFFS